MNDLQWDTAVLPRGAAAFGLHAPVLIVGAGACGLSAALAASDAGADAVVLERDPTVAGTTAMSTGLIPAAGTRFQRERGIADSPDTFAGDILRKARGLADHEIVQCLARESAGTVEWLVDRHDVRLSLVESFRYPGHSALRMHGTPNRTGSELAAMLEAACARREVPIVTEARVSMLFADAEGRVHGVRSIRPDGTTEDISCDALVLACCGFAGNREMLARYIPEILEADFFGHPGNKGDAIRWGRALGAAIRDIGAYQGHGGLAAGRGIPILWPVIMEGGFQVNAHGERFADESRGYSEHAMEVVRQSGGFAWMVFDARLHRLMQEFQDYQDAIAANAIVVADDVAALAASTGLPAAALARTIEHVAAAGRGDAACPFGRDFRGKPPLAAPFHAVKVRGALFHTQGGLDVDCQARVRREDGTVFPNLYAGGGAARGVSGPASWGYIAGNGLLTATTLGRLAGDDAARAALRSRGSPERRAAASSP